MDMDLDDDGFAAPTRDAPASTRDTRADAWDARGGGGALGALARAWTNERHAPAPLPAQGALLSGLLDHMRRQAEAVAALRADPDTSEDEHARIVLVQTEAERAKFVVRAYVRARLAKVEKFARWLVRTPEMHARLTHAELAHAQRYARMVETHFAAAVLQGLPADQRTLDDETAFMPPMIQEPNMALAVFAHARQDCPPVRLPDGTVLEMRRGQTALTPFHVVEQLLLRDEIELV